MSLRYPETPDGWERVVRRTAGPFTTHVRFRRPDGALVEWSSRRHRKHASLVSRADRHPGIWWQPRRASWWIGVLFAVGSTCFFVGPFPGFVQLVGSRVDAIVFFVGSIFFTSAAALQYVETANVDRRPDGPGRSRLRVLTFEPRRIDWWSCAVQLAGTIFFNISTFRALQTSLDAVEYDRLVWTPDALGSICFLVSGYLAYVEVCGGAACRPRRTLEWWIAAVNLAGANLFTSLGALGFLVGAVLLLPEAAGERGGSPASDDAVGAARRDARLNREDKEP